MKMPEEEGELPDLNLPLFRFTEDLISKKAKVSPFSEVPQVANLLIALRRQDRVKLLSN